MIQLIVIMAERVSRLFVLACKLFSPYFYSHKLRQIFPGGRYWAHGSSPRYLGRAMSDDEWSGEGSTAPWHGGEVNKITRAEDHPSVSLFILHTIHNTRTVIDFPNNTPCSSETTIESLFNTYFTGDAMKTLGIWAQESVITFIFIVGGKKCNIVVL